MQKIERYCCSQSVVRPEWKNDIISYLCACVRVAADLNKDTHTCIPVSSLDPKILKVKPRWNTSPRLRSLSTFSGFSPLAVIKGSVCLSVCPDNYPWWVVLEPSSLLPDLFDKFGSCSQNCCWGTSGCLCAFLCVCVIEEFIWELLLSPCVQLWAQIDLGLPWWITLYTGLLA